MSNKKGSRGMEKAQKKLVIANLGFWIHFWAAFAHASYAFGLTLWVIRLEPVTRSGATPSQ